MRSPRRVFISSTCFDLIDARAELKQSLQDQGYIVYASEAPDFPVLNGLSAPDNCLAVVRQSDVYLLIIHTRYGSPFHGTAQFTVPEELRKQTISVTMAEYLTAREAQLEIRIWVRDFIWTQSISKLDRAGEVDQTARAPLIDPGVYSFLEFVKNNPHEGGSWINQFHDIVDLKTSILHWLRERDYVDEAEFRLVLSETCDLLGYQFEHTSLADPRNTHTTARLAENFFGEDDAIWPIYEGGQTRLTWPRVREAVNQAIDDISQGAYDRALFVSNCAIDHTINEFLKRSTHARRLRFLTYGELLESLVPFTSYLERLVFDFEHYKEYADQSSTREPVLSVMRRCDLLRYYVPTRARCSPNDLFTYVSEWLSAAGRNQLTLLGDFGTGKSSFLLWLTYRLARQIVREGTNDVRIPVFVSLRDHSGKLDVREIIVNTLSTTFGIRGARFSSFLRLLDAGRLLIIFDGFDETAIKADAAQSLTILRELNSLVRRNAKVIVSCRTHYFRSDAEATRDIGRGLRAVETELFAEQKGRTNYEIVYLQEFNSVQIEEFLNKHFDGDRGKTNNMLAQMHSTYNLWDLAKRPVLLEMILKVFPRLRDCA